ncbi:hypothetical protein K488DRAFT_88492 [Vararia minispora EC-137]|uniref:Uncharacterized protein n=1 Tax=Vararia minispora EC-137 TaxID=1314806 RepID=A0ACB8QDK8_9AGAM|nr:hypothetical protein K488DRAFT_88492 [Vararia minispora EC-137]
MHPTRRAFEHVHKPLIRFLGRRQWPSSPAPQHPHPAAPKEFADAFSEFLRKFNSSLSAPKKMPTSSSIEGRVYEFWEAPERLFRPRSRILEEWEIEAIESGGASMY